MFFILKLNESGEVLPSHCCISIGTSTSITSTCWLKIKTILKSEKQKQYIFENSKSLKKQTVKKIEKTGKNTGISPFGGNGHVYIFGSWHLSDVFEHKYIMISYII